MTNFEMGWAPLKVSSTVTGAADSATADVAPVGTIDVQGSTTPSAAIRLSVKTPDGARDWAAAAVAGPVSLKLDETDPRKITLSFMASVSTQLPITVRIESLNAAGEVSGSTMAEVYPSAPNFYQRYALELSLFKADAAKPFDPKASQVRFSFGLKHEPGMPANESHELRVDNLALATPSYYVSPNGSDTADGKTERTALATAQAALNRAKPGDIVIMKGGVYWPTGGGVNFVRPGSPAAWITLKNAPGEVPVLRSKGWVVLAIGQGSKEQPSEKPAIAYVEVRGLHTLGSNQLDGNGKAVSPFPQLLGKVNPETNGNGILIDGRYSKSPIHHIRIADCTAEKHPGGGITGIYADWLSFENNTVLDNAWFGVFACSGFSMLQASAFDGTTGTYRLLVSGNRSSGNRCYQKWTAGEGTVPNKISDGNGIIIDTLNTTESTDSIRRPSYTGRTLVVNNVSFNNGGSGIHMVSSPNVDIVNNTTYLNSASPELHYSQIYAYRSAGCNYVNNILVAPEGERYNQSSEYGEKANTATLWSNNHFGSKKAPKPGLNDLLADPKFAKPSRDPAKADFTIRPGSPAADAGTRATQVPVPLIDINGRRRPFDKNPSIGAIQP